MDLFVIFHLQNSELHSVQISLPALYDGAKQMLLMYSILHYIYTIVNAVSNERIFDFLFASMGYLRDRYQICVCFAIINENIV